MADRDWTPYIAFAGIAGIGIAAYYIFHKTTTAPTGPAATTKQGVVYNGGQTGIPSGQPVQAVITMVNTGTVAMQYLFRVDIQGSAFFDSPLEGNQVQTSVVQPGKSITITVSSLPVPTDWQDGKTLKAYVMLIGYSGHWDTSGTLTVVSASTPTTPGGTTPTTPTGHIVLPLKANYDNKIGTNAPLPVSFALTGKGDSLMIVFAVTNSSSASQPAEATAIISGPSGTAMQSWSATMSGNSTTGQIKLTFPASDFAAVGTYTVEVELTVGGELVDTQTNSFAVTQGAAAPTLSTSYANGVISFSFSGMTPNGSVEVDIVETGQYKMVAANSSGNGSGTLLAPVAAGNYNLTAVDLISSLQSASVPFTVPSSTAPVTPLFSVGQTIADPWGDTYLITSIDAVNQYYNCIQQTPAADKGQPVSIDWASADGEYTLIG